MSLPRVRLVGLMRNRPILLAAAIAGLLAVAEAFGGAVHPLALTLQVLAVVGVGGAAGSRAVSA